MVDFEEELREEQTVEFSRLVKLFSWSTIDEFVTDRHSSQGCSWGESMLGHLYAVAKLAETLSYKVFDETDFNAQHYWAKVCRATGLLHESVRLAGSSFEELLELADTTTAKSVCDMTPDYRLPEPRRIEMWLNSVGLASAPAQLVVLADLRLEAAAKRKLVEKKRHTDSTTSRWIAAARAASDCLNKLDTREGLNQRAILKADLSEAEKYGIKTRLRR